MRALRRAHLPTLPPPSLECARRVAQVERRGMYNPATHAWVPGLPLNGPGTSKAALVVPNDSTGSLPNGAVVGNV